LSTKDRDSRALPQSKDQTETKATQCNEYEYQRGDIQGRTPEKEIQLLDPTHFAASDDRGEIPEYYLCCTNDVSLLLTLECRIIGGKVFMTKQILNKETTHTSLTKSN
jgi:hypothetical protein